MTKADQIWQAVQEIKKLHPKYSTLDCLNTLSIKEYGKILSKMRIQQFEIESRKK